MKQAKCSRCFGGCLKQRPIALLIARTWVPLGAAALPHRALISIHFKMPEELCSPHSTSIIQSG